MALAGLIPAHAGSTAWLPCPAESWSAHPRSRGVDCFRRPSRGIYPGSSPLTRGRRVLVQIPAGDDGLIPAHAGSTRHSYYVSLRRFGSSPLTRGRRRTTQHDQRHLGLIPAHAGSTRPRLVLERSEQAHPRSRGVDGCRTLGRASGHGSSPLTRGRPDEVSQFVGQEGLIPAHAGSTPLLRAEEGRARAHPRSRGVDEKSAPTLSQYTGSSPLTRGRLAGQAGGVELERLIPAHAGSTG